MDSHDAAVQWLLSSRDPSVQYLALTEVAGASRRSRAAREARAAIARGPRIRALLRGQRQDGGFGVRPYRKWTGAHWRLVSLVELAVPARFTPARAALRTVLEWLHGREHISSIRTVQGRVRIHASMEGNALAVACRLGLAGSPRVRALAERLLETQWEDGGWNCDSRPEARTSSFYESITPLWGLIEYAGATGDVRAARASRRAAGVFLSRRLFRARASGRVIDPEWLRLHYPLYWHYDVLHGLLILSRLGALRDPRSSEALDWVESKRGEDGGWRADAFYWKPPGRGSNAEIVDWGRSGPNEMITLNALRVLRAAGRA